MNYINSMLLPLFKFYRKRNDSFVAAFHSKGILTAFIFFYIYIVYILLNDVFRVVKLEVIIPPNKIIFLLIAAPVFVLVFFITTLPSYFY
jgi:hypothetical protein